MKPKGNKRSIAGFTLVEMVLTFTILALAGALIFSSFRTAIHSWTAGFSYGRKRHVAQVTLERMAQQLKSALPVTVAKSGREVAAFDGGENYLRFITLLPVGTSVPAQVSYSIEESGRGKRLVYREYPWPDKKFFEKSEPRREEWLPEITGLKVSFKEKKSKRRGRPYAGGEREEWRPGERRDLPDEVEVLLTAEGLPEGESFSTAIPIQVTTSTGF